MFGKKIIITYFIFFISVIGILFAQRLFMSDKIDVTISYEMYVIVLVFLVITSIVGIITIKEAGLQGYTSFKNMSKKTNNRIKTIYTKKNFFLYITTICIITQFIFFLSRTDFSYGSPRYVPMQNNTTSSGNLRATFKYGGIYTKATIVGIALFGIGSTLLYIYNSFKQNKTDTTFRNTYKNHIYKSYGWDNVTYPIIIFWNNGSIEPIAVNSFQDSIESLFIHNNTNAGSYGIDKSGAKWAIEQKSSKSIGANTRKYKHNNIAALTKTNEYISYKKMKEMMLGQITPQSIYYDKSKKSASFHEATSFDEIVSSMKNAV